MNIDNSDTDKNNTETNDLEWQSFRYVLGEMSPAEADAFEESLATDQATRELVARSTGLVTNLLAAGSVEATQPVSRNGSAAVGVADFSAAVVRPAALPELERRRSERFVGWAIASLAAAVCCCVAIGVHFLPLGGHSGLEEIYSGDLSDNGAGHLVAIWSQRLAELAPDTATTEPAAERSEEPLPGEADDSRLATATENAPADSAAVADQIAAEDSDVPGWMVAAVELGQVRKPDGSSSEIWEN
jgi:anti-sigma-K factor RskA